MKIDHMFEKDMMVYILLLDVQYQGILLGSMLIS